MQTHSHAAFLLMFLPEINPNKGENVKNDRLCPIVVIDRSGSMGAWSNHSVRALHGALSRASFPVNDPICLITFDSYAELVMMPNGRPPTLGDLEAGRVKIPCRGSTQMSGVMPHIFAQLSANANVGSYAIIVVSDGEVDREDRPKTISAAQRAATALGKF